MKAIKYIYRTIKNFFHLLFMYIFLVIDRLILVPFPFITSYSAQELAKEDNIKIAGSGLRVLIAIVIFWIVVLIKWIF
jgi:hypothetical protein